MFNIIRIANEMLNSTPISYKEIVREFICEYSVKKENLPDSEQAMRFTADYPGKDLIKISFSDGSDRVIVIAGDTSWLQAYEDFIHGLNTVDAVTVRISVDKDFSDGIIRVYNLDSFLGFLSEETDEQLLSLFSSLFDELGEHFAFHLLDQNGSLKTSTIVFTDNETLQWGEGTSREELWKRCTDSTVFLNRDKYKLTPQDFDIIGPIEGRGFERLSAIFIRERNALSYIFLANTSQIVNDKLILQFDPTSAPEEYELDELSSNSISYEIYRWAYCNDHCVERASIARKIINVYCRDKESICKIDDKILNSIKSDYQIYQKDNVERYVEMKNQISGHITDSIGKLEELSHEMAEALKNNLVAILVFVMTAVLTESFDFDKLIGKDISANLPLVCALFTVISLLYLLITVFSGWRKWKWIDEAYERLKENYQDVLDAKDLEEAFNYDNARNDGKKHYRNFTIVVSIIWAVTIMAMGFFSYKLYYNVNKGTSVEVQIETQEEEITTEQEIVVGDNEQN